MKKFSNSVGFGAHYKLLKGLEASCQRPEAETRTLAEGADLLCTWTWRFIGYLILECCYQRATLDPDRNDEAGMAT